MVFSPTLPFSGLTGWRFLERTLDRQTELFDKSPEIQRDVEYFKENIGDIKTLDDFMNDRRIQKVALGAFGLGEEINKGAFVRKVLDEGTTDRSAFAVRLNNSNYLDLGRAFDFTGGELQLDDDFINTVTDNYKERAFEVELGNVDDTMRLTLNFKREITKYAGQGLSEAAGWFKIMGSEPLRAVIEDVFNLPTEFAQLDIDKQQEILSDKSYQFFGSKSIDVFQDPEVLDQAIRRYHLTQQLNSGPSAATPGFAAITLLSGGIGSAGLANLILSNAQ